MDGYEVCRRLKANAGTSNIPVIFLTAKGDVADETMGLATGAVDYIIKPVSIPIVLARVRTHVELKRRGDLLENLSMGRSLAKSTFRNTEVFIVVGIYYLALVTLATLLLRWLEKRLALPGFAGKK